MWWQQRNTHSETITDKNKGMHKLCAWRATVKSVHSEYTPTTQLQAITLINVANHPTNEVNYKTERCCQVHLSNAGRNYFKCQRNLFFSVSVSFLNCFWLCNVLNTKAINNNVIKWKPPHIAYLFNTMSFWCSYFIHSLNQNKINQMAWILHNCDKNPTPMHTQWQLSRTPTITQWGWRGKGSWAGKKSSSSKPDPSLRLPTIY